MNDNVGNDNVSYNSQSNIGTEGAYQDDGQY